jgi:ketosteroid isomerase-like protein
MAKQATSNQALITKAYKAFNNRDIETAVSLMQPDVAWPNGVDGGYVYGRDAVRDYWTKQWMMIDPRVEPMAFKTDDDGRVVVEVHQVVRDLLGNVISDQTLQHIYTMEDGLVRTMEIRKG